MERVYIVKGLMFDEDSGNYSSIVSEFGVQKTLSGAEQELQNVIAEIREDCQINDIGIVSFEDYGKKGFDIELDNGVVYEFEIIDREVK